MVSFDPANPDAGFKIDVDGRRSLRTAPELLTHITGVNWSHGGTMTLAHLREQMKGQLQVRFDRKIRRPPVEPQHHIEPQPTGINPYTFIVQYGGVQQAIRYLPWDRQHPPRLAENDDCLAVFKIDPEYLEWDDENNVEGRIVYITLKCDFILDCRGNPVDGAHLRGQLPTGNGRGGGIFESWFKVSERHEGAAGERGEKHREERLEERRGGRREVAESGPPNRKSPRER
jgi:hypothetical protein